MMITGQQPPPPVATYRLQFNHALRFDDAKRLVDYLADLGISHVYASPIFRSRPGSNHGYDVVDHSCLNPELGTEEEFLALVECLRARGMRLILDLVPNHMCIDSASNVWWSDVLENGPGSPYARFFDIDWNPPKPDLENKVLLPILGDQYGRVLEQKQIQVRYEEDRFVARYFEHQLPLAPKSWMRILRPLLQRLRQRSGESDAAVLELESILTALKHLPSRVEKNPDRVRERRREKEIIKARWATLLQAQPVLQNLLADYLENLNGRLGKPRSFDRLQTLLAEQPYRLSYWRVASDEINYRRFFDVNDLAAIRIEEPEVAEVLQALPSRLEREGRVSGFRIDHVDGLADPLGYLRTLPDRTYVVVEKILARGEALREDWPVAGTTGYEFLNMVNRLFVDPAAADPLRRVYRRFTAMEQPFPLVLYECKKLALQVALSSELTVLARKLDRISEQHRDSRDFTLRNLEDSLAEVIACFPVYRTYIREEEPIHADDQTVIDTAIRAAKRRNPSTSESVFDFIRSILLHADPDGLTGEQRQERRRFVASFQQLTAPVMAKGLEDTAFYRYYPLASLAEVGGSPDRFWESLAAFHAFNAERLQRWPAALSATSTHDTKRDEDVRARLDVLSELPQEWEEALQRWHGMNHRHRTGPEYEAPDTNEEYLLYQTLLGSWPLDLASRAAWSAYVERIQGAMAKALREAKKHTSWVNPRQDYEGNVRAFVQRVLDPEDNAPFVQDMGHFVDRIARPGLLNGISQMLLKITSPGVPDFYQGTEIPAFRLVDPDNRGHVDFEPMARALDEMIRDKDPLVLVERLLAAPQDGRLKLFCMWRALRLRQRQHTLFARGTYEPLRPEGPRQDQVIAYGRQAPGDTVVTVVARFFTRLPQAVVGEVWAADSLSGNGLVPGRYREALTGQEIEVDGGGLSLARVFRYLPFALLEATA